jgi:hypothetical protein
VELLSFAAGLDPDRIDINLGRSRMSMSCKGAALNKGIVEQLRIAFDSTRPSEIRHRALVGIEKQGGLSLLAAFALESSRVFLEWTDNGIQKYIELGSDRMPRPSEPSSPGDFAVSVVGRRSAWKKEMRMIARRCRFARFPVRLNGERLDKGLALQDCLVSEDLSPAVAIGIVGVTIEGDLLQVTRLANGIAMEDIVRTAPNGIVLNAVVEGKKDELASILSLVEDIGERLYTDLAQRFESLSSEEKQRVIELLIKRSVATGDEKLLSSVPAFPQTSGPPLGFLEVKEAALNGPIWAVDSDASISSYEISNRLVLRLDGTQRRFLERDIKIELRTPPQRARLGVLKARLGARARCALERIVYLLNKDPGRPISDDRLSKDERVFLDAVRAELKAGAFALLREEGPTRARVVMAEGQRRLCVRTGKGRADQSCLISRSHPHTRSMVAAFARGGSYLYPALLLLTDGKGGYTESRQMV